MPQEKSYKTYGELISERFQWKMQKLAINAGFSCPNRDGTIGTGGCSYCNNQSFVPSYCVPTDSVTKQLEKGKQFFGKKYPNMHYLAYFQAYTSTHSKDRSHLVSLYEEALKVDKIEGIIISTRPDCVDINLLDTLKKLEETGKQVMFEIGVETTHDITLSRTNRGHSWKVARESIRLVSSYGFDVCVHLIMGMPGETKEDMRLTVERICKEPITSLKLHQMQIIEGTPLASQWRKETDHCYLFSAEEYIEFCRELIDLIPKNIAIERFTSSAPDNLLLAPRWGLKNYEFTNLLDGVLNNQ